MSKATDRRRRRRRQRAEAETIEQFLIRWAAQGSTAIVTPAEKAFIAAMRAARDQHVGYGWMQQMIEIEWHASGQGTALGPNSFFTYTQALKKKLEEKQAIIQQLQDERR